MKTLQETCHKKAHNTITGIHGAKETQRMISIRVQIIEKKRTIVKISQKLGMEG